MPPRGWHYWLGDILEAIRDIQRYTAGMDFKTFATDRKTLHAVAYCFIIIGEAARHVPPEAEARYPEVPWAKMRGMRNVLVHEYPWTSPRTLWDTATINLPPLVPALERILAEEDSSQS
jgi:uncharacterized protein with HEPN domain